MEAQAMQQSGCTASQLEHLQGFALSLFDHDSFWLRAQDLMGLELAAHQMCVLHRVSYIECV